MSIHVSGGGATLRRVVISCDVAGCPIQVEPPAAERWRSDTDARSWARTNAVGWTHEPVRGMDYCPDHTEFGTPSDAEAAPPRPTAAIRDSAGNPLNRDDYTQQLRARLARGGVAPLTGGEAEVTARLLEELAGVYRDEPLATLARELVTRLNGHLGGQDDLGAP